MKIRNVYGQYWDDTQSHWGTVQAATEYESLDDCPIFLEWQTKLSEDSAALDGTTYYKEGEDEPFAVVEGGTG